MNPKATLAEALEIAQRAVLLDAENDVPAALRAYSDACELLSKVLGHNNMSGDRRKLHQIYETYTDRIRLLNALHPRLSSHSTKSSNSQFNRSSSSSSRGYNFAYEDTVEYPGLTTESSVDEFIHNIEKELATSAHISPSYRPNTSSSLIKPSPAPRDTLRQRRSVASDLRNIGSITTVPPRTNIPAISNDSQLSTGAKFLKTQGYQLELAAQYNKAYRDPHSIREPVDGTEDEAHISYRKTSLTTRRPSLNTQDLNRARSNQSAKIESDPFRNSHRSSVDRHSSSRPSSVPIQSGHGRDSTTPGPVLVPDEEALVPPSEPLTRPYWMMRLLSNTFASAGDQQTGTFITKDLFVPKDIWQSQNVKIKGEEEKIQANQILIEELQQLGCVDREDLGSLFKCLANFEKAMDTAQQILSKKLGADLVSSTTIPIRDPTTTPVKKMSSKTFTRFLKGSVVVGDRSDTIHAASTPGFWGTHTLFQSTTSQLFDMAQLIDQITLHLNTESLTIKEQVRMDQIYSKAADFFSRVIIKLYLADLSYLICCRFTCKLT